MPILNKPNMNYGVWADNGNIEIPSSEKVEQGWVIEKPLNETMNWLQNRSDRMLQYLNQRGIPEWDVNTEYPTNSFVARSGTIYRAISQNQDTDPTLHPDIWKIAFVSYSDFLSYSDKVNNIENEEGYLGLYVSKSEPVMTGAARGLSYNDSEIKAGLGFEGGVAKIHKDLEVVAEFSGGTNPKDVVTHEQLALAIQNYKVGDIYITTSSGDPSDRLGYGTWERFAEGRTLVGFSSSVSNSIPEWVKTEGGEFGSYEHKLTESQLPVHKHGTNTRVDTADGLLINSDLAYTTSYGRRTDWLEERSSKTTYTTEVGGGQPHNNVQPSIVVYFWKRVS
ncbi:tail fiber protein [Vibrio phage vB_VhaM_VH-8]|nr:tail fiber protein [Vibrio phage vB_VhaM_VH-8]